MIVSDQSNLFPNAAENLKDQRVFLGWDQPCLHAIADALINMAQPGALIDLSDTTIVLPTSRAGRLLIPLLLDRVSALGRPCTLTPTSFVSSLPPAPTSPAHVSLASSMACELAWEKVLEEADADIIDALVGNEVDRPDRRWLINSVQTLHEQLTLAMVEPEGIVDIAPIGFQAEDEPRFEAFSLLRAKYCTTLDRCGLADPGLVQTSAIRALEPDNFGRVVLAGVVEMSPMVRKVVDQLGGCVQILVCAPKAYATRFDRYGCVLDTTWCDEPANLNDQMVRVGDSPHDQAMLALRALSELGKTRADDVAIGIADDRVARELALMGPASGVDLRRAVGQRVGETNPWQLLSLLTEFVQDKTPATLAALSRHPDFEQWLTHNGCDAAAAICELDDFRMDRLPHSLNGRWYQHQADVPLSCLRDLSSNLVHELTKLKLQTARTWAEPIRQLMHAIYANREFDERIPTQHRTAIACRAIGQAIDELGQLPDGYAEMCGARGLELVLEACRGTPIATTPARDEVEMLQWLDLAFDPASSVIVTSLNEGLLPAQSSPDPFLSESLRQDLGLMTDRSQAARDAFWLCHMVHSRASCCLIAGRKDAGGQPLFPSRLLLRGKAELIAIRLETFFERTPGNVEQPVGLGQPGTSDKFSVLSCLPSAETPLKISVTAFGSYLRSPREYLMTRLLKLSEIDDDVVELGPMAFGNLLHKTLEQFGLSDIKDSTDSSQIKAYLFEQLEDIAKLNLSSHPMPAVALQLLIAKLRLEYFACWQARRRAEGWQIQNAEWQPTHGEHGPGVLFDVDDEPILLTGKIDRIDKHEKTGAFQILDYKTGNKYEKPQNKHIYKGGWINLQLPLYRHLAQEILQGQPCELGFILLSAQDTDNLLELASWDDDMLDEADATARWVVRQIREGNFAESGVKPADRGVMEDLVTLCIAEAEDEA